MAKLAIIGHKERGEEVIKILEMLGGKQGYEICTGSDTGYHWYIKDNGLITCNYSAYKNDCVEYTLEEFLQEFPYKVGDKVKCWINGYCGIHNIRDIQWDSIVNEVKYRIGDYWYSTMNLQPCKEETMDRKYNVEEYLKVWEETEKGLKVVVNDKFELKEDNGKFYIIKKQPQYPKTYEECCKVLNIISNNELVFSNPNEESEYAYCNKSLYNNLNKLKICRDAYWKLYGEQMGLGKPWEPDYKKERYVISRYIDEIVRGYRQAGWIEHFIFEFPTEEMRDAFYENFKELIEKCKELL